MIYTINKIPVVCALLIVLSLISMGLYTFINDPSRLDIKMIFLFIGIISIAVYLTVNIFLRLELTPESIIRVRTMPFYRGKVVVPYSSITYVSKVFMYKFNTVVEAEVNGKTIWLVINMFNNHRDILKTIISKIDKSKVDPRVVY